MNLLFDQADTDIAGVTALHTEHTTLDLGRSFHYVGVQLFPGVWTSAFEGTVDHYVGEPYEGELPLVATNRTDGRTRRRRSRRRHPRADRVRAGHCVADDVIAPEPGHGRDPRVDSTRSTPLPTWPQSRRCHRASSNGHSRTATGFSPHDLLKVLRLQRSFRNDYLLAFTDQSHYTHSFRAITGYTPAKFRARFDV